MFHLQFFPPAQTLHKEQCATILGPHCNLCGGLLGLVCSLFLLLLLLFCFLKGVREGREIQICSNFRNLRWFIYSTVNLLLRITTEMLAYLL